jgi:hypothetical protein
MRNCFQSAEFTAIRRLPFDRHEPVWLMNSATARCSKSRQHADLKRLQAEWYRFASRKRVKSIEALANRSAKPL